MVSCLKDLVERPSIVSWAAKTTLDKDKFNIAVYILRRIVESGGSISYGELFPENLGTPVIRVMASLVKGNVIRKTGWVISDTGKPDPIYELV
ncbi:MAG: hypothetical protein D6698_04025 [Gammaproteobacteria bacterium]|nr:MAG: hypothetical protein D6698_04025 [Gammaproteobacteria bacterium]